MTDKAVLNRFLNKAAHDIAAFEQGPEIAPFTSTEWIANSLLQKAIRRNRPSAARQAGRFLLATKGNTLFRRLNVIAAEDIGLADVNAVATVAACLSSAKIRRYLGGDKIVTDYLIQHMCDARKSRAADDLLMSLESLPSLAKDRTRFAAMTNDRLREIILGCPSLDRKALALWYLIGTKRCPSLNLKYRAGDPALAFTTLAELGVSPSLVGITQENFTKTAVTLAPFVALLSLENGVVSTRSENDATPVETMITGVPSWAIDRYTRPGRAALGQLLHRNAGMASWAETILPRSRRIQMAGELLFRIEGQCLHNRADGTLGAQLWTRWEQECAGLPTETLARGMTAMREAMPQLNAIRAEVQRGDLA